MAIGTGNADRGFLSQVTGNPGLVLWAASGQFEEAFRAAERLIASASLLDASSGYNWVHGSARTGARTALLALELGASLIAAQNRYLRKGEILQRDFRSVTQDRAEEQGQDTNQVHFTISKSLNNGLVTMAGPGNSSNRNLFIDKVYGINARVAGRTAPAQPPVPGQEPEKRGRRKAGRTMALDDPAAEPGQVTWEMSAQET